MRLSDAALGVLVAVLGGAVLIASLRLPGVPGQEYGAGFFPAILGTLIAGAGAALFVSGMKRRDQALVVLPAWLGDGWAVLNVAILAAAIILFAVFGDDIGFIPFAVVVLWLVQVRLGTPMLRALVVAAVGAFALHLLFGTLLRVPLPDGILEGVL